MSELTAAQILAQMQEEANQYAEAAQDMNIAVKGGGGGRLLPEGYALGRLVQYVELGDHADEYQGKKKDPARVFFLAFALTGQGYQEEDGSPYIKRTFTIRTSANEKAQCYKLFKRLNYDGTAKTFAQLLGKAYLVPIKHVPKKDANGNPTSEKSDRIDLEQIIPPFDPVSKQPYPIPEARAEDLLLFLYDRPTMAAWNKLHIEGTNDAGKSKNWMQEEILKSTSFAGSALERLLGGGAAIPTLAAPATGVAGAAIPASPAPVTVPSVPAVPAIPAVPSVPVAPAV